ncbi:hypothetical protein AB0N07_33610 [Streptomyces sp. NPDC051172]|uniref:hypothetical protein n=1 Tax=Streptomyces sp. NPDC051172 TaxID=3155796 RepID=UPI003429AA62
MASRFGAGHLMLGTDHPFLNAPLETAPAPLTEAGDRGILDASRVARILGRNADDFLGL